MEKEANRELEEKFWEYAHWYHTSKHLPKSIKEIIEGEAYQRGHSGGYREVLNVMGDVVEFAKRCYEIGANE